MKKTTGTKPAEVDIFKGGWGSGGGKKYALKTPGWISWYNVLPTDSGSAPIPILHVVGCIDIGNESDGAYLSYEGFEKSNPPNLLLKINLKTILIPREPGDTVIRMHYSQRAFLGQLGKIIIFYPDGDRVEIDFIPIIC